MRTDSVFVGAYGSSPPGGEVAPMQQLHKQKKEGGIPGHTRSRLSNNVQWLASHHSQSITMPSGLPIRLFCLSPHILSFRSAAHTKAPCWVALLFICLSRLFPPFPFFMYTALAGLLSQKERGGKKRVSPPPSPLLQSVYLYAARFTGPRARIGRGRRLDGVESSRPRPPSV